MPPIPTSIVSKLTSRNQAVRWTSVLKEIRQFRAYCCNINASGIMGVAKEPVILADISPGVVCLGASISWDLTQSYAPGSTITSWSIDFGDSNSSSGGSIASASGTHTYAAIGTYIVIVTVTEGTGLSQTVDVEVNVVVCGSGPTFNTYSYASTGDSGVYFIDWTVVSPSWVARNTGLSGNALNVRSLVMNPRTKHLNDTRHELWAATKDGIYKTEDGGRSWGKIILPDPSNIEFDDNPASVLADLDYHHIVFDQVDEDTIYVLASR